MNEATDKFRSASHEAASQAHGAARDDKDMRSDRITAKLLDMVDNLQRDVMENMKLEGETVRELKGQIENLAAKVDAFMSAFPEGDAIQHRMAHEAQIKEAAKREKFWGQIQFTVVALLLSAGVVWIGIVVWKAFLLGPK